MKGYIYKIEIEGNLLYIGSTIQRLSNRKAGHKSFCFKEKFKNRKIYKTLREEFSIKKENFNDLVKIVWICDVEYEEKHELGAVEARYIKELKPPCNCRTPHEKVWNKKEYDKQHYDNNKQRLLEKQKDYYNNNKEHFKEKRKELYKNNKETILKNQKDYYNNNKQRIKEYKKEYGKQKITCECGCELNRGSLYRHKKSKKHIRLLEAKLNNNTE